MLAVVHAVNKFRHYIIGYEEYTPAEGPEEPHPVEGPEEVYSSKEPKKTQFIHHSGRT